MRTVRNLRPSAPFVINAIALFIVLGGQAIARTDNGRVQRNELARGSVTTSSLAPGVVGSKKLAKHVITSSRLGSRAFIGRMIDPGAVHGQISAGTYGIPATIPDLDPAGPMGSDGNWTSSSGTSSCNPGGKLIGGGVSFGDRSAPKAFLQSTYPSSTNASTWIGEISTDTGGQAQGQRSIADLSALCFR